MIIRMIYVLPMILGRTYDVRKSTVGIDIFPTADVQHPKIMQEPFYRSNYKTVESSSDIKDVLEVSGGLSLNIKSGALSVAGYGAYVKSSLKQHNSVEILMKVSFRTESHSLPHSAKPTLGWQKNTVEDLGTHYVQTIFYGGDLIAAIRFKAINAEDLQEIRATVDAAVSVGSALDLVGGGKLESLNAQLKNKASMEIDYFATVPLEGVANTIEGLRDLVNNFEMQVKKVNNGRGVPVEVELKELSTMDQGFDFVKNMDLETELEFFEEYLNDLLSTKSLIKSYDFPDTLNQDDIKQVSLLYERVNNIVRTFFTTIDELDLEKGTSQLDSAKDAYSENKPFGIAGKFHRELNRLLKKISSKSEIRDDYKVVYTHFGSSQCTEEKPTSLIYSGYAVTGSRNRLGSGYNVLCLPKEPQYYPDLDTIEKKQGGTLAGIKFGELISRPFPFKDNDIVMNGVVCAVCLTKRQTVFTFYDKTLCPEKGLWTLQYAGYLMTTVDNQRSEHLCVDKKLEAHKDSYMGPQDHSLEFVIRTDSEKSYFVPCVVCSK